MSKSTQAPGRNRLKQSVRWGMYHGVPRAALARVARKGDLSAQVLVSVGASEPADLIPLLDALRSDGELHQGRLSSTASSHAAVRELLASNDFQTGLELEGGPMDRVRAWAEDGILWPVTPPSMLATEPPDHTRYRKLATRVFTVRAVEKLRARTQEIADALLDELDPTSPVDLAAQYCARLPLAVICEILGVRPEDQDRVLRLGTAVAPSIDVGLSWRAFRDVEASLVEFQEWLAEHLAHLREHPSDNLLSQLAAATEDGTGLTDDELKINAALILTAGFETTVNLIGNGISLLDRHPDQLARLQADPTLWLNTVDEVLRVDPPVLMSARMAVRDTVVAGAPVARGTVVTALLAGANRDAGVFTDPHTFDVGRGNAGQHLAFSAGRHFCLGASLARMEGEVGLRTLFQRYPDLSLLPGARRRSTQVLRGFEVLPARLV